MQTVNNYRSKIKEETRKKLRRFFKYEKKVSFLVTDLG